MGHFDTYADFCLCVSNHNPEPQQLHKHHILPLYAGGLDTPENTVLLCPTSHVNVHELLREYEDLGGKPPWVIRRHFNKYIRDLADEGWKLMEAK